MKIYKKKFISGITIILLIAAIFGTVFYVKDKNRDFLTKTDLKNSSNSNNKLTDEISILKKELENLKTCEKDSEKKSCEVNKKLASLNKRLTLLSIQQMLSGNKEYITNDNNDASKKTDDSVIGNENTNETEKIEAQIKMQVDYMESAMESQESDPEWSNKAYEQINTAYKNSNMKEVDLVNSECKTTLCKMEFLLNSGVLAEEGFSKLTQNVPWDGQGFVTIEDGNEGEASCIVVYLAKEGHSLETLQITNDL